MLCHVSDSSSPSVARLHLLSPRRLREYGFGRTRARTRATSVLGTEATSVVSQSRGIYSAWRRVLSAGCRNLRAEVTRKDARSPCLSEARYPRSDRIGGSRVDGNRTKPLAGPSFRLPPLWQSR